MSTDKKFKQARFPVQKSDSPQPKPPVSSKDRLSYFKDNVVDPSDDDFDPNIYMYNRDKEMMGPNGFANGAGYSGPTGAGGMMSLDNYASSTIPPSYSAAAALPFQQSQSANFAPPGLRTSGSFSQQRFPTGNMMNPMIAQPQVMMSNQGGQPSNFGLSSTNASGAVPNLRTLASQRVAQPQPVSAGIQQGPSSRIPNGAPQVPQSGSRTPTPVQSSGYGSPADLLNLLHLSQGSATPTGFSQTHQSQGNSPPLQHMNKLTPGSDFGGPATSDEEYQPNGIRSSGSVPAPASSSGSQLANTIDEAVLKPWGLMGLTRVLKMSDKDLTVLSLGTDLTTLGLNLSSPDVLYATFASPWASAPLKRREPEFQIPSCYYIQPPLPSPTDKMSLFSEETLFFIFYSMPKDALQATAAAELYARDWRYHMDLQMWFHRMPGTEPLVKTATYERGSYLYFDLATWSQGRKDNYVLDYDKLETLPLKT